MSGTLRDNETALFSLSHFKVRCGGGGVSNIMGFCARTAGRSGSPASSLASGVSGTSLILVVGRLGSTD